MKATILLINNKITPTPLGFLIKMIKKQTESPYNHGAILLEFSNGHKLVVEAQTEVKAYPYNDWLHRCERNDVWRSKELNIDSIHIERLFYLIGANYQTGIYFDFLFKREPETDGKRVYCFELIKLVFAEMFKGHKGIVTANDVLKYVA